MKRILAASGTVLAVFVFAPAALAQMASPAQRATYHHLYAHARAKYGPANVGCDLIGRVGSCHRRVTSARIEASINVLRRLLAPPPPPPAPSPVTTEAPAATSAYTAPAATDVPALAPSDSGYSGGACGGNTPYAGAGQCWAIPYSVVACESGGQNVPNSQGSGAMGYYQLMVGGTGSRAEQDAAAHALWANGAGAGNWTCAH